VPTPDKLRVAGAHASNVALYSGTYGNGAVDVADYVVWRKGLRTIYTRADFDLWRARFGQTAGSAAGSSVNAAVPEPAT
jgi:hypothetical protein